ncbi:MAG TPA: DUF3037 domain-containing protein [Gemmatimonadaceae bacterium]|nr:DUF3037 domain-containing protein [Gemmatimonadaceae bacterium]
MTNNRAAPPSEDPELSGWISYNFAVLRVVPHVHLGTFIPVGIVLHARTTEFIAARVLSDLSHLHGLLHGTDVELLSRYLKSCEAICAGHNAAGPIALAPPSERFHWLTAPRSDVIQSGPVHEGLCEDPKETLDELYQALILSATR